ncbi:type VI secretion protein ImpA [Cupriavidus necator]|uniref:Type VI secretion protein ImpA n=1 Tax=Cupriavidus necator TaxID=106590 RepID=A0A1U9V1X0_CUPNE|nr:type VI secretion system protein TssA [Cupriavidus necator]AQV98966.1 type VI secretion protein ImpA [Cupriavidus necator]
MTMPTPFPIPDAPALLAPVPGDDPAGPSLRYDPVFRAIAEARQHDDDSLPMREWECPLVKADWKRVAALAGEALATRSKDFQLAAWLFEAWTHLHGAAGFCAGVRLLGALVDQYWDSAWPRIEDGDADARSAPIAWLNETLPAVLALHVPLLSLADETPVRVTLDLWERSLAPGDDDDSLGREALLQRAQQAPDRRGLDALWRDLHDASAEWAAFDRRIDALLGAQAPSLVRVTDTLARLVRAVAALRGDEAASGYAHGGKPVTMPAAAGRHDAVDDPEPMPVLPAALPGQTAMLAHGRIEDRAHAYQLIRDVADYLARHEPHSPTPHLLRRAVRWGEMPLADLMQDILREEGDIGRYFSLLEN